MVVVTKEMEGLGIVAAEAAAAGLSMQEQYQAFADAGGRLTHINWRNCVSAPGQDTVIPVRPPDAAEPSTA